MILKAIRTNCRTGVETIVKVTLEKEYHESLDSWWWQITKGGVTGYESIKINDTDDDRGWWACAGTKGRWDSLHISSDEMKKLTEQSNEPS